jgi:transmembrane protein EpsG
MNIGTLIFYFTVIISCTILTMNWSKTQSREIRIKLAYAVLALVSIFRYDIGNDYSEYVFRINELFMYTSFENLSLFDEGLEPFFLLIVFLFKSFAFSYFWIIGIYSILGVFVIYKIFSHYNIHYYAFLMIFINGLLFSSWDWIRQGVAIVIFLYAIRFIKEHNFKKYLIYILLAATSHLSVLILLPFYFISRIPPMRLVYIVVILGLAFFASGSEFQQTFDLILRFSPIWYEPGENSLSFVQFTSEMYKIRIIFYSLVWCGIIYYLPNEEKVLINLLFVGAVLFIIANGALNLMRIANYFVFTTTISLPLVLRYLKTKKTKLKINIGRYVIRVLLFGLVLFFINDVLSNSGVRGCVPYKSVFSKDFQKQILDK